MSKRLKNSISTFNPAAVRDIAGSYDVIGDDGAEAIRQFVKSGKDFIGICMGAYLADKDWIGLIDAPLESEVGKTWFTRL